MSTKVKIIVSVIVVLAAFAAGFAVSYFIDKVAYTKSTDKLSKLLNSGNISSQRLYDELEQRLRELDGFREQADAISKSTNECLRLVEQSGQTIGQLGRTVEGIGESSSNIKDTIEQLRKGQQSVKQYVGVLEENNRRLEEQLGRLQEGSGVK